VALTEIAAVEVTRVSRVVVSLDLRVPNQARYTKCCRTARRCVMSRLAIFYATREGHTHKVADHLKALVEARGHAAEVIDVAGIQGRFDLAPFDGAIVAGSVHAGLHEPELRRFAARHAGVLETINAGFISVSLSEVTVEDRSRPSEARAEAAEAVRGMMEAFYAETGWRPRHAEAVAGALPYTKYGMLKRFVMKRIVRRAGGPTDTSRDYEFTDWAELDRFADEILDEVAPPAPPAPRSGPSAPETAS
jgi:menaquinone-dependent protoporphyrinogen oxidase